MLGESLDRLMTHLFEQLSVYLDLSPSLRTEKGPDVLPQSPGSDNEPKGRSDDSSHAVSRYERGGHDDHVRWGRERLRRIR